MSDSSPRSVITELGRSYLRLHMTSDVGPVRASRLIEHFKTPDAVFAASTAELERVSGIGPKAAAAIFRARHDQSIDEEVERATKLGVHILSRGDEGFPKALLQMNDPPICLWVRGRLLPTDCVALSIVGTRRCSHYGREQARRFAQLLGQAGFTIISGLARGIDSHAHRAALECGARTVAVLGSGLGNIYPPEHGELADEIAQCGAVISEDPVDSPPDTTNFPRRNRIIAGLALGVLVIEAGGRSGALITARLAGDYNREVFAIPGRVDQPTHTEGVHRLIRDGGAKLVTCLEDILDELKEVGAIMKPADDSAPRGGHADGADQDQPQPGLSDDERTVLSTLTGEAKQTDAICSAARLSIARVNSTLTALQLKGLVTRLPGNQFARRRGKSS